MITPEIISQDHNIIEQLDRLTLQITENIALNSDQDKKLREQLMSYVQTLVTVALSKIVEPPQQVNNKWLHDMANQAYYSHQQAVQDCINYTQPRLAEICQCLPIQFNPMLWQIAHRVILTTKLAMIGMGSDILDTPPKKA